MVSFGSPRHFRLDSSFLRGIELHGRGVSFKTGRFDRFIRGVTQRYPCPRAAVTRFDPENKPSRAFVTQVTHSLYFEKTEQVEEEKVEHEASVSAVGQDATTSGNASDE